MSLVSLNPVKTSVSEQVSIFREWWIAEGLFSLYFCVSMYQNKSRKIVILANLSCIMLDLVYIC